MKIYLTRTNMTLVKISPRRSCAIFLQLQKNKNYLIRITYFYIDKGNLIGLEGKALGKFFKSFDIWDRKMFYASFWKLGALVLTSKSIFWKQHWPRLVRHGWLSFAATPIFSSSIYHKIMGINHKNFIKIALFI